MKNRENKNLFSLNLSLAALVASLNQTIQELKEQLNKNSKNSSKFPSSDGFKKPEELTQIYWKEGWWAGRPSGNTSGCHFRS